MSGATEQPPYLDTSKVCPSFPEAAHAATITEDVSWKNLERGSSEVKALPLCRIPYAVQRETNPSTGINSE